MQGGILSILDFQCGGTSRKPSTQRQMLCFVVCNHVRFHHAIAGDGIACVVKLNQVWGVTVDCLTNETQTHWRAPFLRCPPFYAHKLVRNVELGHYVAFHLTHWTEVV